MTDYKVVPTKPTTEMMVAASQVGYPLTYQNVLRIWNAMINAAPVESQPSDTEVLDWFMPFMNDIPKLIEFRRLCTTFEEGVTREAIKSAMEAEREGS